MTDLCSTFTTGLQFKVTSFDFKKNEKLVGCDERKLVKFKMLAGYNAYIMADLE